MNSPLSVPQASSGPCITCSSHLENTTFGLKNSTGTKSTRLRGLIVAEWFPVQNPQNNDAEVFRLILSRYQHDSHYLNQDLHGCLIS